MNTCRNCDSLTQGNFCNNCGQKNDFQRLSVAHVSHDVIHAVTHTDKGIFRLVKELFFRPGIVSLEYVEGRRKRYLNPLTFLVISSALMAYVMHLTGYMQAREIQATIEPSSIAELKMEANAIVQNNNGKMLGLFLIAPLSACLTWLFFRRSRYNFAENFVLNCFIFGEGAVIRTFVIVPLFLLLSSLRNAQFLTFAIYEVWFLVFLSIAFRQFFKQQWGCVILKAVLVRVLFVLLFWGLVFLFVIGKHSLV